MTTLEQAQELRQLAEKFSEGWHDGIAIDASDVMLLLNVANALEQQDEPVAEPHKPATEPADGQFMSQAEPVVDRSEFLRHFRPDTLLDTDDSGNPSY
jgi:hypothetical protein